MTNTDHYQLMIKMKYNASRNKMGNRWNNMEYVPYGKTGMKVSRFGLGCMRFPSDEKEAIEMVRYAMDNGVNHL